MSAILPFVPWALFGIMVLFGMIFMLIAVRASRRARAAEKIAHEAQSQIAPVMQRAQAAEAMIGEAQSRAMTAEGRIAQAEASAQQARDAVRAAEQRAQEAETRSREAAEAAQRADASLRERKDAATEKARKAEQRARSLLDWARSQWEARREPDRQRAQGQQGSFQAQLDAYLQYRRTPISFRVENDIDRMAAPLISGFAQNQEQIEIQGDLVRVTFPVDPSLGFRA